MPGIIDRPVTAEVPGMLGDYLVAEAHDHAVGIGADLDGPPRSHGHDWRAIFVGDAAMSPYEITHPGGANEHWNRESGQTWLTRAAEQWPHHLWINPVPEAQWGYSQSTRLIQAIFDARMVPMTLEGIARGVKALR